MKVAARRHRRRSLGRTIGAAVLAAVLFWSVPAMYISATVGAERLRQWVEDTPAGQMFPVSGVDR